MESLPLLDPEFSCVPRLMHDVWEQANKLTWGLPCHSDVDRPGCARCPHSSMSLLVLLAHLRACQPLRQGRSQGVHSGYFVPGGLSRRKWTSIGIRECFTFL